MLNMMVYSLAPNPEEETNALSPASKILQRALTYSVFERIDDSFAVARYPHTTVCHRQCPLWS